MKKTKAKKTTVASIAWTAGPDLPKLDAFPDVCGVKLYRVRLDAPKGFAEWNPGDAHIIVKADTIEKAIQAARRWAKKNKRSLWPVSVVDRVGLLVD